MAPSTLTDARVRALDPRKSARDIRGGRLKGFGVRVMPLGAKRWFIHCQHDGSRVWRTVGDAAGMGSTEARPRTAAIRQDGPLPASPVDTVFEAVAEATFRRHGRIWKPRTMRVNQGYLRCQILPRFAGRQVADITRRDVVNWFTSPRAVPVAADRSMPVLSVIMREAERMGYRQEGSNPCPGIRRYRRKGGERFLSDAEVRAPGACPRSRGEDRPLAVAAIRLLLLTGCRRSEILALRRSDLREGALFLRDSRTGSRTVWLSRAALAVLDGMDRTSPWAFPGRRGIEPLCADWLVTAWHEVRAEASLGDVRLHDLRQHSGLPFIPGSPPIQVLKEASSPMTTAEVVEALNAIGEDRADVHNVGTALRRAFRAEKVCSTKEPGGKARWALIDFGSLENPTDA